MLRLVVLRALASALLLSAAVWTAEAAATNDVTELLSSQARYWESQNRYDLARENWLKLLRSSPSNVQALEGLIKAESVSGRSNEAQVYLDRLKTAHPSHPGLKRLETQIRQGSFDSSKLTQPRALAREGQYQKAVDAYLKAFGGDVPDGRLGLEYYQTLAGTENGWEPAREGILRLVQNNPDEPIYRLALAQHLTYRESTRRQGISQLAALQAEASVATPARQAWRQALIWLGGKRGDEALYSDYLRRAGDDAQVRARLQSIAKPEAAAAALPGAARETITREATPEEQRGQLVRQGFAALEQGNFDLASAQFQEASSQYGESADAVAGLGIIRLRQLNYPEARQLLERATALDPKRAGRWKEALDTARFWEAVGLAQAARKAGDSGQAETALRGVIARYPQRVAEELSVPISLADILNEQGQLIEAEKVYRDILRRSPENIDALRGLMGLLASSKRLSEAIALSERLPAEVRNQMGSLGVLKAQYLREQAADSLKKKDDLAAEEQLKEALLLDPESPWTRLDLSRIYQRQGRAREANALVDSLMLGADKGEGMVRPEILFIKASLMAEQQDFLGGLNLLEQVPASARTPAMNELQKRLWVRYEAQRATVYSRAGQQQQAVQILARIQPQVGETPELLGALAGAYADVGDEDRALRYMRQALARNNLSDAGLRMAYAGLLFKLRQDTELEVVLVDLLRRDNLTEQQMSDLENLRIGYRLRQADVLREERDLARAYEYLEPLIRSNPADPRLMMSLARLYNDSKDYDKAYAIYQRVLEKNANDVDAYKGAIGAALSLNRADDADLLLEKVFALEPNNPRLYALAGRAAKARGDEGRALQLFQQALRLDAEQASLGEAPVQTGTAQPILQLIGPQDEPLPTGRRAPVQQPEQQGTQNTLLRQSRQAQTGAFYPQRLKTSASKKNRFSHLPRGDVSLSARHFPRARLVKVSTPPRQQTAPRAVSDPSQPDSTTNSGYWAEELRSGSATPSYRYVESLTLPRAGSSSDAAIDSGRAAQSEFPPPRRVNPSMSRQLSLPGASSQSTVRDLNAGSAIYEAPQPQRTVTPTPTYQQRAPIGNPYPGTGSSYWANTEQSAVPPPPPSRVQAAATLPESDPLLATPEFVLDRNRTDSRERRDLLKEVGELRSSRTPYLNVGTALRSRGGSEGLDRLQDVEAAVEFGFPATEGGRFKLRATPVYLDGGTVSGQNLPLYGALGLALAQGLGSSGLRYSNSASGIAFGVGYEVSDFKADIGTSPLGFPVETIVGGINWRPKVDRLTFKIDIGRRSLNDSLLSYAGLRDPATGLDFGGVTKSGVRLDLAYDLGKYGIYGNGSYHVLNGEHVAQNAVMELGGGIYARAIETRSSRVTYGLNLTTFGYNKNLRRFSFGHGGYFSPQSYLAVSVPLEWEGYGSRFSYKLGGALGLQAFSESAQVYYPNDDGLQTALATALGSYTGSIPIAGAYPSQRQIGVGFKLDGQLEYLLDPNLALGARLALDNARNYNETSAFGYLRYMFYPQSRVSFPPKLLLPYFNFGDTRL